MLKKSLRTPAENTLDIDMSDVISLAAGITFEDGELSDQWLRSSGYPNDAAAAILGGLSGHGATLRQLVEVRMDDGVVDHEVAERQVRSIIEELDESAKIRVRRKVGVWLSPWRLREELQTLTSLSLRRRPARRYSPTPSGLVRASLRQSTWPFILGAVLSIALGVGIYAQTAGRVSAVDAAVSASVIMIIVMSNSVLLFFHELGHLVALRLTDCKHSIVAIRGLRIGLVFPTAITSKRFVAAAGPLSAVAVAIVMGMTGLSSNEAVGIGLQISALLGIGHLGSLGPWAADGRLFWGRTDNQRLELAS